MLYSRFRKESKRGAPWLGSKPCSIREKYKRVVRLGGFEISEELVVFFTNLFVNVHNRVLKFEPQLVALNWALEA